MLGTDRLGSSEGGRGQRVMDEQVDLARQPTGGLVEGLLGSGLEELELGAGGFEQMGKVGAELVASEALEVGADDDARGSSSSPSLVGSRGGVLLST